MITLYGGTDLRLLSRVALWSICLTFVASFSIFVAFSTRRSPPSSLPMFQPMPSPPPKMAHAYTPVPADDATRSKSTAVTAATLLIPTKPRVQLQERTRIRAPPSPSTTATEPETPPVILSQPPESSTPLAHPTALSFVGWLFFQSRDWVLDTSRRVVLARWNAHLADLYRRFWWSDRSDLYASFPLALNPIAHADSYICETFFSRAMMQTITPMQCENYVHTLQTDFVESVNTYLPYVVGLGILYRFGFSIVTHAAHFLLWVLWRRWRRRASARQRVGGSSSAAVVSSSHHDDGAAGDEPGHSYSYSLRKTARRPPGFYSVSRGKLGGHTFSPRTLSVRPAATVIASPETSLKSPRRTTSSDPHAMRREGSYVLGLIVLLIVFSKWTSSAVVTGTLQTSTVTSVKALQANAQTTLSRLNDPRHPVSGLTRIEQAAFALGQMDALRVLAHNNKAPSWYDKSLNSNLQTSLADALQSFSGAK